MISPFVKIYIYIEAWKQKRKIDGISFILWIYKGYNVEKIGIRSFIPIFFKLIPSIYIEKINPATRKHHINIIGV